MKKLFTAAALLAFASVVMGAVVCATESGTACPNWPGCYADQFAPAGQLHPMIEFIHRVVAAATGPVVLAAAILGRRLRDPRPRRLAWLGLAGTISAGVFGMLIVKIGIPWWLGVVDLASALVATVALLLARLLLAEGADWAPGRTGRLAWSALGTVIVVHLLALAVAAEGSYTRCLSWPLVVLSSDRWPELQWLRITLAVVAAGLVVAAAVRAWPRPEHRVFALLPLIALAVELLLGAVMLAGDGGIGVRAAFSVVAAALFWLVALFAARVSVRVTEPALVPAA